MSGPHSAAFSMVSRRASGMRIMVSKPEPAAIRQRSPAWAKVMAACSISIQMTLKPMWAAISRKIGVVEIEGSTEDGFSVGLLDRLVQTVHANSKVNIVCFGMISLSGLFLAPSNFSKFGDKNIGHRPR